MVSAGMKIVKYLLFIFNFVFLVTGLALIGVGTAVHIKVNHYFDFVSGSTLSVPILLISVGCIISIIAFFGCCGACKENYCMIVTFSVFLTLIFVVELGGGIAAYVYRGQLKDVISKKMNEGLQNYGKDEKEYGGVKKTWDAVQHDFTCCGANNYTDWQGTYYFKDHKAYPKSCCKVDDENCDAQLHSINQQGCRDGFLKWAESKASIVGGVGLGIAFVQIMGIVFACCLASAIKREYEVV